MLSDSMAPELVRSSTSIQQTDRLFQDYPHASEHQFPVSMNSQANIESLVGGDIHDRRNHASFSGASSFESSAGLWRLLQAAATLEPPEVRLIVFFFYVCQLIFSCALLQHQTHSYWKQTKTQDTTQTCRFRTNVSSYTRVKFHSWHIIMLNHSIQEVCMLAANSDACMFWVWGLSPYTVLFKSLTYLH